MDKHSFKYAMTQGIVTAIFALVIFPLFDFIACEFITNSKFSYRIDQHVVEPIVFGIAFGIGMWLFNRKKK